MDNAAKSIMSSLSLAYTFRHDLSVQMSTQQTECGESKLNCEEKKHILYNMCTHTQKTRDKERNSIEDWSQIAESCCHSKQRTRQVSQISPSMGMICSISSSFSCNSQLLCTSQLSFCVFCCFALPLFRRKISGTIMVPLSCVQLRTITLRVAHSI